MRVTKENDIYRGSHISGPTHNFLALRIAPKAPQAFEITVLPAVGSCSHGEPLQPNETQEWIALGVDRANGELGTSYGVEHVEVVANDNRRPEVYIELARRIVHAAHEDFKTA